MAMSKNDSNTAHHTTRELVLSLTNMEGGREGEKFNAKNLHFAILTHSVYPFPDLHVLLLMFNTGQTCR